MSCISAPTNDPMLHALNHAIRNKDCVAFIGAGMSLPDYPDWNELLRRLATRCDYKGMNEDAMPLPHVAEQIKAHNSQAYWAGLAHEFRRLASPVCAYRYHLLARIPFASYITTNYDPLLLDILHLHRNIVYSKYQWLSTDGHGKKELFYIHGRVDPDEPATIRPNIVLTQSEYTAAYNFAASKLPAFLQSTLTEHDVCFLGCGLNDDYLSEVFKICKYIKEKQWGIGEADPPEWFAVVDDSHEIPATFFDDYGVRVVRFPRSGDDFVGLDQLLEHWASVATPTLRKPAKRRAHNFLPEPEVPR